VTSVPVRSQALCLVPSWAVGRGRGLWALVRSQTSKSPKVLVEEYTRTELIVQLWKRFIALSNLLRENDISIAFFSATPQGERVGSSRECADARMRGRAADRNKL
jgi:hypothetical protein